MSETSHADRPFPLEPEPTKDLRPLIDHIQAGTYEPDPDLTHRSLFAHLAERKQLNEQSLIGEASEDDLVRIEAEGMELRHRLKPELNAYTALIIDSVWNEPQHVSEREALLAESGTMYEKFDKAVKLFDEAVIRWFKRARESDDTTIADRYTDILRFETGGRLPPNLEVQHIRQGIGTALSAAFNLADVVMTKCEELELQGTVVSPDQALAAIRRAYRHIGTRLASMNLNLAVPLMNALWSDPDMFTLKEKDGEYVLFMRPERIAEVTDEDGVPLWATEPYGETTRCPAMYAIDDRSAVVPDLFKYSIRLVQSSVDFPKNS